MSGLEYQNLIQTYTAQAKNQLDIAKKQIELWSAVGTEEAKIEAAKYQEKVAQIRLATLELYERVPYHVYRRFKAASIEELDEYKQAKLTDLGNLLSSAIEKLRGYINDFNNVEREIRIYEEQYNELDDEAVSLKQEIIEKLRKLSEDKKALKDAKGPISETKAQLDFLRVEKTKIEAMSPEDIRQYLIVSNIPDLSNIEEVMTGFSKSYTTDEMEIIDVIMKHPEKEDEYEEILTKNQPEQQKAITIELADITLPNQITQKLEELNTPDINILRRTLFPVYTSGNIVNLRDVGKNNNITDLEISSEEALDELEKIVLDFEKDFYSAKLTFESEFTEDKLKRLLEYNNKKSVYSPEPYYTPSYHAKDPFFLAHTDKFSTGEDKEKWDKHWANLKKMSSEYKKIYNKSIFEKTKEEKEKLKSYEMIEGPIDKENIEINKMVENWYKDTINIISKVLEINFISGPFLCEGHNLFVKRGFDVFERKTTQNIERIDGELSKLKLAIGKARTELNSNKTNVVNSTTNFSNEIANFISGINPNVKVGNLSYDKLVDAQFNKDSRRQEALKSIIFDEYITKIDKAAESDASNSQNEIRQRK